jgi:glycosyltransferase involved in cell wall biosynthesis
MTLPPLSLNDRGTLAAAIPAYDAQASIGDVVRRTRSLFEHVLVVDDGSSDATGRAALESGARVLRHPRNLGKGRALRTAFEDLFGRGFPAVVTLDADGQHMPEQIPRLVAAMASGADLVIGCREHLFDRMHPVRRASNRWSSRVISWFAGRPFADVQCGFRVYTRGLVDRTGFPEPRFEAESAVVVRAARLGMQVVCVPVDLGFADGRTTSHYRPVIDSLRIAGAVIRARIRARAELRNIAPS